ncbi:MAG: winged helix-turn-helix domain-containing protein, partial [Anaerococcus sp.]|nr:winged helix-turn-helix domain-containing protein [Anaerococcus sp.]
SSIQGLMNKKRVGNRRNMTFEEEEEFLKQFEEKAEKGQIVTAKEIEKAYIEKVGHSIGGSQIYYVLKRHGFRKIMPRSRHPKKASKEVIEDSKN